MTLGNPRGSRIIEVIVRAILVGLLVLSALGCNRKTVKQSLAAMAVAPASRDDWWEPRRDPDPTRPLGAEITHDPYANEQGLFEPTPEQADTMNAMAPILAGLAIFFATGEIPAILFVEPIPPTQ